VLAQSGRSQKQRRRLSASALDAIIPRGKLLSTLSSPGILQAVAIKCWTSQPERFKLNPFQENAGTKHLEI
jgi:hypothetical protein